MFWMYIIAILWLVTGIILDIISVDETVKGPLSNPSMMHLHKQVLFDVILHELVAFVTSWQNIIRACPH